MCLSVGVIGGCTLDVCAFEIALGSLSKKQLQQGREGRGGGFLWLGRPQRIIT
jgi:hypothetical protein